MIAPEFHMIKTYEISSLQMEYLYQRRDDEI